jgi:hypothetical protein
MVAYIPKATVQAAIGGIPLAMGLPCGNLILTVAVLSILITAPLGAVGMDLLYAKWLTKINEMDLSEAILQRHSVRKYTDQPIAPEVAAELQSLIEECNKESGLHMQLILNDSQGMSGLRSIILKNAHNYLAIVGKNDGHLDELGGYWGEKVVLRATQLGIASCWFGMGTKKDLIEIGPGEKLLIVVTLGYAAQPGKPHLSKPLEKLYSVPESSVAPDWFIAGVEAAQLAPTARNQQQFRLSLTNQGNVKVESLGGVLDQIDLGIVKCHFEIGAAPHHFTWA